MKRLLIYIAIIATFVACSTTSKLPEGEVLYTGVKNISVQNADSVDSEVRNLVKSTLEVKPNSSFLGSAYRMSPFPLGLWVYNGLYPNKETGFKHWIWDKFKSDPTLVSSVNPELRARAATIKMEEEGYFDGVVSFDTIFTNEEHTKAKIAYNVRYPEVKTLSSVTYLPTRSAYVDRIIENTVDKSLLKVGDRFSTANLEGEIDRIVSVLRDSGYFFYDANSIKYYADSTRRDTQIALRVVLDYESKERELKPCVIDSVLYELDWGYGLKKNNHDSIGFMRIDYNAALNVRPKYLRETLPFDKGVLYNPSIISLAKTKIDRLNTFKYTQTNFSILDQESDTTRLLLHVSSTYNLPWQGTIEARALYKDIRQVGPELNFTFQKRNFMKGGEIFQGELRAGYEWTTGSRNKDYEGGIVNSFEFGGKVSLIVPRLQLPRFIRPNFDNPVSTRYSLSADVMRRSGFFNMMKIAGELSYTFYTTKYTSHTITPVNLTYNRLLSTTAKFDSVAYANPALLLSFSDQFIPQIKYSYVFDNTSKQGGGASRQYFAFSLAEAGGIMDILTGMGHRKQGDRRIFGQPFSQFVKATVDLRNYHTIKENVIIASRFYAGVIWAYGNSEVAPYTEQFYIGGANSLRGFGIRTVGPGSYRPLQSQYSYLDQTGDFKLEANVELRFPIVGSLHGALFADAGNVWTMREREDEYLGENDIIRDHTSIGSSAFLKQIATDIGLGLRYDLGMLVVRFDVGVPIHDPAGDETRYYNPSGSFFGNLGYHLAVGYPF